MKKVKVELEILEKREVEEWRKETLRKPSIAKLTLLVGDRWSCVEKVAVAKIGGRIVGVATIAPQGEMRGGLPSIVALYVEKEWRNKGIGTKVFEKAVVYMIEKGLMPIEVVAMNSKVLKIIEKLDKGKREKIKTITCVSISGSGVLSKEIERLLEK